ncbi:MAG TPA: hypothetical protein DCM05_04355 [Elusimicrobia bacterium]|nr:hypothetical protein [Elusimicrobiota bacterium]
MRKAFLWAAALLPLAAPAPAQQHGGGHHQSNSYNSYNSYNTYSPPPDPVKTKVQGAKQNFDYTLWAAESRQNEIKAAEKSAGEAQTAKDQGKSKIWRQDGYYWKEVAVDEAIASDQEKIDQKKQEQEELKAKAEQVATEYVDSEAAHKDKFGSYYSPDTFNTANEIVQQAASMREQSRRASEEDARLSQLEKDEKLKEAQKGRNDVKIPVVGKGRQVDNIEIDPMKMNLRPTESPAMLAQAPNTGLKGTTPKALPHDLKPVGDQGTVARIEAPLGARRGGPLVDPAGAAGAPMQEDAGQSADPARAAQTVDAAKDSLVSGDFKKAVQLADEALRQEPRNSEAQVLKSKALARLRDFYGAEDAARKALELAPDSPEALRALAWALLHSGKYREASEAASRAIALDPKDAEAYALRAFAFEKLGDKGRMLDDLRRASELDEARFGKLVKKAAAGETVFDPSAEDSYLLLESVSGSGRGARIPLAAAALFAGLTILGIAWTKLRVPKAAPVQEASAPAASSSLLGGKYQLKEALGEGVWKAWDPTLGRALFARRTSAQKMSLQSLAALNHPNIEEIYEVVEQDDGLYVLGEWLEGQTLESRLCEGPLGPGAVKDLLGSVCEALTQAHAKGVAHGALSSRRILLTRHGQVKVLGFGSKGNADVSVDLPALAACAKSLLPAGGSGVAELLAKAEDPDLLKRPRDVSEFWGALKPLL